MDAKPPKGIGYWFNDERTGFPNPRTLVRPNWLAPESLSRLVRYLRSAPMFCGSWGHSFCRFECGVGHDIMGSHTFWDGVWVWPEGLSHYVELHDVALPDTFVQHALSVPVPDSLLTPDIRRTKIDWDYWLEWTKQFR